MGRYTEVNYTIDMECDWKIAHGPKGYAFAIKRQDSSDICTLHCGLTPQDKALANLISAAPDLLAALEAIVFDVNGSDMFVGHYTNALLAIQKARGERDE